MPLVVALVLQGLQLVRFKLADMLKTLRVSRYKSSFREERSVLLHSVSFGPFSGLSCCLLRRQAL